MVVTIFKMVVTNGYNYQETAKKLPICYLSNNLFQEKAKLFSSFNGKFSLRTSSIAF